MGIGSSFDPYDSDDAIVDKVIGNAYKRVAMVAEALPSVIILSQFIQDGGVIPNIGLTGKSAYDIAVDNGFAGNQAAWLSSLRGERGQNLEDGTDTQVPWTPYNCPGLMVWWNADNAPAVVDSWTDELAGLTLRQASPPMQPVRVETYGPNNKAAVYFDGLNDGLESVGIGPLPYGSDPSTIMIVGQQEAEIGWTNSDGELKRVRNLFGYGDGDGDGSSVDIRSMRCTFPDIDPVRRRLNLHNNGFDLIDADVIDFLGYVTVSTFWGDGLMKAWINGQAETPALTEGVTYNTSQRRIRLSGRMAGPTITERWWQGRIRHVFGGNWSDADRQRLEGWAAWESGLQYKLPDDHPYKEAAPTRTQTAFELTFPKVFDDTSNNQPVHLNVGAGSIQGNTHGQVVITGPNQAEYPKGSRFRGLVEFGKGTGTADTSQVFGFNSAPLVNPITDGDKIFDGGWEYFGGNMYFTHASNGAGVVTRRRMLTSFVPTFTTIAQPAGLVVTARYANDMAEFTVVVGGADYNGSISPTIARVNIGPATADAPLVVGSLTSGDMTLNPTFNYSGAANKLAINLGSGALRANTTYVLTVQWRYPLTMSGNSQ